MNVLRIAYEDKVAINLSYFVLKPTTEKEGFIDYRIRSWLHRYVTTKKVTAFVASSATKE